jgi:type I restriction enzyme M protein
MNDGGRAAVVLDTGAVSRGSRSKSSNKEKNIRQAFVEGDLVEGVVLLPDNLFYNTTAPGIVVVLNRHKNNGRKGQFLLINASGYFVKQKPKNKLTNDGIDAVSELFHGWQTREKVSRVVTLAEVRESDYNLSPSSFVESSGDVQRRPLADILRDLTSASEERVRADACLQEMLTKLGLVND